MTHASVASKKDGARSALSGLAQSVTQPGGMDVDWVKVRSAGAAIAGLALLHGVGSRRWRYMHTVGVVVGVAAALATILKNEEARDSRR